MLSTENERMMEGEVNMNPLALDKDDPRYIAACVAHVPQLSDPNEVEITKVMEGEILSTPLARNMVEEVRRVIRENWQDLYAHRKDPSYVHAKNQEGTAEVARITNATIVSGQEHLQELEKGKPVFFSANHFGFFKLVGFKPEDLRDLGFDGKHAVPDIYYPPIPFYARFYRGERELVDDIYMAAQEEAGTLGELSRATGSIDVPPPPNMFPGFEGVKEGESAGRVGILTESTIKFFKEHPNSALVVFPEGGTTGKRNGGNTRELGRFHAGLFAIAATLELPVVLLAHRFNPNKGFEISVAGVVRLGKNSTREEIQGGADRARGATQAAFDQLHTS